MSCQIDDLKGTIWMLWLVAGLRLTAMVRRSRVKILQEQKEKIEKQLKQALTIENTKNRKLETRDKILLGVMFQGLIAEGAISTQVFEGAVEKYLKGDKDRERCDTYFERHRFQASEIELIDVGLMGDDQTLSVETGFETTTPDEQANSDLEEGMAIGDTILDEGLTDIDIEPI